MNRNEFFCKKNVYLVQPTYMNGSVVYLPYAIGALASYAWKFEDIKNSYLLKKCFFLREDIQKVLSEIEDPFLIGFSCYMWNMEYNKILAEAVKKKFPDCIIVFGGQQIPPGEKILEELYYVDLLIHHEGEIPFRNILRAYNGVYSLENVGSLSFRQNGVIINNPPETSREFDFPSPYQSGFFDRILEEYPNLDFVPLLETNRGCPNYCTYCSWGRMSGKVRLFPLERVFFDIEWVSRHKMEFLGAADANFGLFPRDEIIVDKLIEQKQEHGYPKKFQVSYAKDSPENVFRITEKLNKNGMDKGVTLSFQSMSPTVQKYIGRSNMLIEQFKDLNRKYLRAGIATYTDLILGLPGETLESFNSGIEELLEMGQHTSLFIHLCEWLPCSEMGQKEYMEQYGLKYAVVPINQPHASSNAVDDLSEKSRIIIETASMSSDDWKKSVLFFVTVLCFHTFGLLQCVGLYLYFVNGVKYSDFYGSLLAYLLAEGNGIAPVFKKIEKRLDQIIGRKQVPVVFFDDKYGNIAWPFEEYAFLTVVSDKARFYAQIKDFLQRYIEDKKLCEDLLRYQDFVMKSIREPHKTISLEYDWKQYFRSLLSGNDGQLIHREISYEITDKNVTNSWAEYARNVLWFGRRGGSNLFTDEITEIEWQGGK